MAEGQPDPDVRAGFPPQRLVDSSRHNLPVHLTPLVGRVREVSEVGSLIAGERLVTLIGSAGVGKTRLALAVAVEADHANPGGVWWVELASVSDPAMAGRTALAVLGGHEVPSSPVWRQVAVELGDDQVLLVLDNCEHLSAACAELAAGVLAANPSATIMATSREPLGVPGEVTWRVPSLPCPDAELVEVATVSSYDAVALFLDRARRARPAFAVSEANAAAIAQICCRLDGIPLAIELAAARCRQLPAERIADELDDRFRLLTGGARTLMPRYQTLAASLDWSHDRLDSAEQRTLRRLAPFAGPFPLDAAEAVVAAGGDVDRGDVLDLVGRLVDKSLVLAEDGPGGAPRYRLLETLRAYALDRARDADELVLVRDVHAAWWGDWLAPRYAMPTDQVLAEVEEFHGNLTAALEWSVGNPAKGLVLLERLSRLWMALGRFGDATAAADRLLTADNAERNRLAWVAAATNYAVVHSMNAGHREFVSLVDRVDTLARPIDDPYQLAVARWTRSEDPADDVVVRDLARERGDRYIEAVATVRLAADLADEDPIAAVSALAEADAVTVNNGYLADQAKYAHALAALSTGELLRCVELARALVERQFEARIPNAINVLSFAALMSRDHDALAVAADVAARAERKAAGFFVWADIARHRVQLLDGAPTTVHPGLAEDAENYPPPSSTTLWQVTREAIDAGAADLAIAGVRAWARAGPHGRAVRAAVEAAATGDEDHWHQALSIATAHRLRLVAAEALEGLASAAARNESWVESLRLLASAHRLRDDVGYQWRFAYEAEAVDDARAGAWAALGEDAARTAFAEGERMDWREAAAYAQRARGDRKRPRHGWASLSPTEQHVVALVTEGLTNPQIAERLLMGRATVKTHLEHIFTKLGVRTCTELASIAIRHRDP